MRLRESEAEIMDALWSSGEAMSSAALLEAIPERTWKERSIFAILDGLLKKGLIYEAGFVRRGKTIARTFAPTMTYPDFLAKEANSVSHKPTLSALVSAFLASADVTEQTLSELEEIIAKRRDELKK